MSAFRRKKIARPPGAGLTYCAGFDLAVRADGTTALVIEVDQERWGGTELRPPRRVAHFEMRASQTETVLRVATDDGALGHPCAEAFHLTVWLEEAEKAEKAELTITETQTSREARVINGRGWTADYPVFAGPTGLRLEYRSRHGYLD